MKKKLLAALLTASMVATMLVGCGGSTEEAAPSTDAAQTETKTEETKTETAEAAPAEKQDVALRMWGAEED